MVALENYREIRKCRVSGSPNLISVLNLGYQALTGVFPKDRTKTSPPARWNWCGVLTAAYSNLPTATSRRKCTARIMATCPTSTNRWLTISQIRVSYLERFVEPSAGDVIVYIGANDANTFKATAPGICGASASIRPAPNSASIILMTSAGSGFLFS
jgi:hypothetical protein